MQGNIKHILIIKENIKTSLTFCTIFKYHKKCMPSELSLVCSTSNVYWKSISEIFLLHSVSIYTRRLYIENQIVSDFRVLLVRRKMLKSIIPNNYEVCEQCMRVSKI